MNNAVRRNLALGQSTWIDYIHREMLTGGEIERLVNAGVTGLTSNPTIFEKAISGSGAYDSALAALAERESDPERVFEALAVADVKDAARALRPVYDETLGRDGYVSLEVSPALAYDAERTVREARRLWAAVGEPNLMIKVPATRQGIPAVAELIGEGLNVNVTLIFALDAYERVMDAYVEGLRTLAARGGALDRAASVASFFVSRVDTAVDAALGEESPLRGTAAVANARAAYALFRERFAQADFAALQARGGASAAASVGEHERQESGLSRHALRGRPDRAGHREHDAAGDAGCDAGPRRFGANRGRGRRPAGRRSPRLRTRAWTLAPSPKNCWRTAWRRSRRPTGRRWRASKRSAGVRRGLRRRRRRERGRTARHSATDGARSAPARHSREGGNDARPPPRTPTPR